MTHFPYRIHHRHTYILPTRFGVIFLLALLLMLIGSINYKNNLGFLLTFLLAAMTLVSIFFTYRNLLHIEIKSHQTTPVFAGEMTNINLLVHAPTFRAAIQFGFKDQSPVLNDLSALEQIWITITHRTYQRGLLKPEALIVSTLFPFGLFRAWTKINAAVECLVYPKPISGRLLPAAGAGNLSGAGTFKIPGVDDFEGLKSYQPGDSLQHISWKTYSSGQGLYIKEFAGIAGQAIIFDWAALKALDPEKKLSRMCAMVLKAHQRQMKYGLKFPHQSILPGKGPAHRNRCLRALATYGL